MSFPKPSISRGQRVMQKHLSPRQFAHAIGVSESSVRRWADNGQIKITRTAGGHRKIARAEAIRFIRETSVHIQRPDLLQLGEPQHRRQRVEAFAAQHEQLLEALERGQADVVSGLVTGMYVNGVTAADICDGALRYALQRIGERWPDDKRGILIEHRATSICIEALNQLRANFPPSTGKVAIALGGSPENDPYLIPTLMVSTVLADVGFAPVNLGPNTPLEVLSYSALETDAKLVWIAVTSPLTKTNVEKDLSNLARSLARKEIQVVIGGRGSRRYRLPTVANVHTFASMSEMAGFARGLLRKRSRLKKRHRPSDATLA